MKKGMIIALSIVGVIVIGLFSLFMMWRGYYNDFVTLNQQVNSKWATVESQYQRRYDLIPNLVSTVKGVANFEKDTYIAVANARAQVGQVKLTPEQLSDPQAVQKFQQAQNGLGSALSRLLVVSENYPQLKASENFKDLQTQLEGTENRINVSRIDYNKSVEVYNTSIMKFPGNIIAGMSNFKEKQYFKMDEAAKSAPKVQF
jgi:LemA protein